jgi:nucleotide-binding universal stress UspA family protein
MSVLICYDGSPSARRAVAVALSTVSRDDVTLLHVWTPPIAYLADAYSDPALSGGSALQRLDELAQQRAQEIAADGARLAQEHGAEVSVRVQPAGTSIWRTILDVADELDCKLIVLGTRGLTAVQSALLGSVSSPVVHHSERPVMIVPKPRQTSGAATPGAEQLTSEGG